MITLVDIKKSINSVLKNNFPDCKLYAGEVTEGFTRPCFFTQVFLISSNHDTINYVSNELMIVINFFSKNQTELENLKMTDELKSAFGMTLKVNDRYLKLEDIKTEISDGVLQFKFDLNYLDRRLKTNKYETMKELEINREVN